MYRTSLRCSEPERSNLFLTSPGTSFRFVNRFPNLSLELVNCLDDCAQITHGLATKGK